MGFKNLTFILLFALITSTGSRAFALSGDLQVEFRKSLLNREINIDKPFFYELSYQGKKSYVLGTMHIGVPASSFHPSVLEKFFRSEVFLGEIDLQKTSLNDVKNILEAKIKNRGYNPHALTNDVRAKLSLLDDEQVKNFEKIGMRRDIALLYGQDLIANYVNLWPALAWDGNDKVSMDIELQVMAKKLNKPTIPLEDVHIRQSAGHKPVHLTVGQYLKSNAQIEASISRLEKIIYAYVNRDADYFKKSISDSTIRRNQIWIPTLMESLKEGDAFIAVGVKHLLGDGGLLNLLNQEGVEIREWDTNQID
jgi:uncharacterized protein YbaP (TraB family)